MGAWGEEPFENDSAGDFMLRPVNMIVDGLQSNHPFVVRAAAQAVAAIASVGYPIGRDFLDDAVRALEAVAKDKDFMSAWKDPGAARESLRQQIRELKAIRSARTSRRK